MRQHVDLPGQPPAPAAAGDDLAALSLDRLADVDGIVVDLTGMEEAGPDGAGRGRGIGAGLLLPYDVAGKAVLLRTGWDARWGSAGYHAGYPFLTAAAARHLADAGAVLVGIDAPNVDDTDDPERPAHAILLAAGRRDLRAPHRTGGAAGRGLPVLRRAAQGGRLRHLPGPGLCHLVRPRLARGS